MDGILFDYYGGILFNYYLQSTGGYNHDLFLKTLYDLEGGESAGLELDNYSYTRYNGDGDKLRMKNGCYLTLIDNIYSIYNESNELLDTHRILQKADIDIEDRVEVGRQLIKNWIV